MKPSAVLAAASESLDALRLHRKIRLVANCPLGCQDVLVKVDRDALYWVEHRGTHPTSVRCFWSERVILDQIGHVEIDLMMLRKEG